MPTFSPDHEIEELNTDNYQIVTYNKPAEAVGILTNLLHFDHRYANFSFSRVVNEIAGIVAGNNYIVVVRKIRDKLQPVAFLGWNQVDEYCLTLRANGIRPLAPSEVTRGHITLLNIFSSPFSNPEQMMEFMQENSQKLQDIDELVGLDTLFIPSDDYATN